MTYQSSLLTRRVRIAIMCTLIALFFVISPIVIMYTAGYRYSFSTNRIIQTGVISIDIEPQDSRVTLNNVVIDKQMPIRLTNRAPGKYSLILSKDGYHTLEQIIEVNSKQTTYLRDITLFRDVLPVLEPTQQTLLEPTTSFFPSAQTNEYIVHTISNDLHEIGILSYSDEVPEYTAIIRTVATNLINAKWSPYGSLALVQLQTTNDTIDTYLIDTVARQVSEPLQTTSIPTHHWTSKEINTLYIQHNDNWFTMSTRAVTPLLFSSIDKVFVPTDATPEAWLIRTTDRLYSYQTNSTTLTFSTPIDAIIAVRGNTILATSDSNILIFEQTLEQATLIETIEDASLLIQGTLLYITNPWSITRIDREGQRTLVLRTSNMMSHISLIASDRPELVLTNSSGIAVFDPRFNTLIPLIQNTTAKYAVVDDADTLYFFGTVGRQTGIFSLEI